jgi:hypothetical protein
MHLLVFTHISIFHLYDVSVVNTRLAASYDQHVSETWGHVINVANEMPTNRPLLPSQTTAKQVFLYSDISVLEMSSSVTLSLLSRSVKEQDTDVQAKWLL